MSREPKNERFIRLAEARVNKIIKMVRLLGNLSWSSNYEYNTDQVSKIFRTLQTELNTARQRFATGRKNKHRFSLSDEQYESDSLKNYPSITLMLPDGSYLSAYSIDDENFPAIELYWENGIDVTKHRVCFVEYNPERSAGQELCVGVYKFGEEDTYHYAPFNKTKEEIQGG